jgi:8-oxo-dGTP diphosphatase
METRKFVLGFMFDEARELVLLIRKTKPASIAGQLNGIGGKVEPNETFEDAMVREFEEEVGIRTTKDDWEHCLFFTGNDSSVGRFAISVYRTFGDPYRYRRMEKEVPSVWMVDALPTHTIVNNLKWMLPMLADRRVIFPLAIEQS